MARSPIPHADPDSSLFADPRATIPSGIMAQGEHVADIALSCSDDVDLQAFHRIEGT